MTLKKRSNILKNILLPLALVLAVQWFDLHFDLTQDQRYTLDPSTISVLEALDKPLKIDIFLSGKLPTDYLRFQREIQALIQSMEKYTDQLIVEYIDPFEGAPDTAELVAEMNQYGLTPEYVISEQNQAVEQTVVFPWAMVNDGNRTISVPLIEKNLGDNQQTIINRSIGQIEFKFFDAFFKISQEQKKVLAVLTSHDTSEDVKIADLMRSLQSYYQLASFDLKALENDPIKTLENLKRFELLMVSNPRVSFSEQEKYLLDQHLINGGKQLWMVNPVAINRDSLFNIKGSAVAIGNDLNMGNAFFKYGFRLEKNIIKDLYSAPIVLATGAQSQAQYLPIPWPYYPLVAPNDNVIGNGISNLWFKFASTIDTVRSSATKTPLVSSSDFSKSVQTPITIALNEASDKLVPSTFNQPHQTMGILVKGSFSSAFENRIKPVKINQHRDKGKSQMIIFSDGTLAENQVDKGSPLELGYDKWTNNFYGNKRFLNNCIHYLMGNNALLEVRSKAVNMVVLDRELIAKKSNSWRIALLLLPLLILGLFGAIVTRWRKAKYGQ